MTQDDIDSVGALLKEAYPTKMTQGEQLVEIRTLLRRVIVDLEDIKTTQKKDVADLAALKNKGTGVLIGVSIVAGLVGAKVGAILSAIVGVFKP